MLCKPGDTIQSQDAFWAQYLRHVFHHHSVVLLFIITDLNSQIQLQKILWTGIMISTV